MKDTGLVYSFAALLIVPAAWHAGRSFRLSIQDQDGMRIGFQERGQVLKGNVAGSLREISLEPQDQAEKPRRSAVRSGLDEKLQIVYDRLRRDLLQSGGQLKTLSGDCKATLLNEWNADLEEAKKRIRRAEASGKLKSVVEIESNDDAGIAASYYSEKRYVWNLEKEIQRLKNDKFLYVACKGKSLPKGLEKKVEKSPEGKGFDVRVCSLAACRIRGSLIFVVSRNRFLDQIVQKLIEMKWYLDFRGEVLSFNRSGKTSRLVLHRNFKKLKSRLKDAWMAKGQYRSVDKGNRRRVIRETLKDSVYKFFSKAGSFKQFIFFDESRLLFVEKGPYKWVIQSVRRK